MEYNKTLNYHYLHNKHNPPTTTKNTDTVHHEQIILKCRKVNDTHCTTNKTAVGGSCSTYIRLLVSGEYKLVSLHPDWMYTIQSSYNL